MANTKQWYKSKAIWAAVITGILGVIQAAGVNFPNEVYALLGAFGLYSLRVGDKKIA